MFGAICFDLDDTLLDRAATLDAFIEAHYRRYDLGHVPYQRFRARFHALDAHGCTGRDQLFAALIAEFGIPAPAPQLAAEFRWLAWQQCRLFPDTLAVLAALRARGHRLAIITNGSAQSQRAKLRATGLGRLVDLVLISGEERLRKPDPAIFARAAARLGVAAGACLFVGDNPRTDIAGAAGAGFATVWLRRGLPWPADLPPIAGATVGALAELLDLWPVERIGNPR